MSHALYSNRGTALEELIDAANARYRSLRVALIDKYPTAFVPIRSGDRFISAKVEKKSIVDYRGHAVVNEKAIPLAFEAKEVSVGDRFYLKNLSDHQYKYLRDNHLMGGFSFVLIAFWQVQRFYVLPFLELEKRRAEWKKGGKAHVKAGEPGLIEVCFPDYLSFLFSAEEKRKKNGKE